MTQPGTGSRFAVLLPLTTAASDGEADMAETAGIAPLPGGLRVLIAEDNATNRETLEMFLSEVGVSAPVCVCNGQDAVRRARRAL